MTLDVESLVCAANKAKALAGEIDLLDGLNAHHGELMWRKSVTATDSLLPIAMLRDVVEKGLTALRNIKVIELESVLRSVSHPAHPVVPIGDSVVSISREPVADHR